MYVNTKKLEFVMGVRSKHCATARQKQAVPNYTNSLFIQLIYIGIHHEKNRIDYHRHDIVYECSIR